MRAAFCFGYAEMRQEKTNARPFASLRVTGQGGKDLQGAKYVIRLAAYELRSFAASNLSTCTFRCQVFIFVQQTRMYVTRLRTLD